MAQGERVKYLRKDHLNMTLEKFGEKIGVGKSAISDIERGRNNLSDQMAKAIAREFNVSENWLRTGQGEMLVTEAMDEEIARLIREIADDPDESFKKKLLSILAKLTEEQWELLAEIAEKFAGSSDKEKPTT